MYGAVNAPGNKRFNHRLVNQSAQQLLGFAPQGPMIHQPNSDFLPEDEAGNTLQLGLIPRPSPNLSEMIPQLTFSDMT